jgi:hypothetical protein
MPRAPRWWRQLISSRYCPRCLAANGGRWMLAWRIPWTYACTCCQVLLADTCPDCGRRHQRTRTGQPRQPGRCDLTGLPLPPPRRPRGGLVSCTSDPADTTAVALPSSGHVLRAQQHINALIAEMLTARRQPARLAAIQHYLDDTYAVARAAIAALPAPVTPPAIAVAVLDELGTRPGASPACREIPPAGALTSPAPGQRRQFAPVTGFGVTIADIMLHDRRDDPDPALAAWIAEAETSHTGAAPAPPCKPPSSSQPQGDWTPSTSSATAPWPARPASPIPLRRAGTRRSCRRYSGRGGRCVSCPRGLRLPPLPLRARHHAGRRGHRRRQLPRRPGTPRPPPGSRQQVPHLHRPAARARSHGTRHGSDLPARPQAQRARRSGRLQLPSPATPLLPGPARRHRLAQTAVSPHSSRHLGRAPPLGPRRPTRRDVPGTPRPAPPDRAADRHSPVLPARAAPATRTPRPRLRRVQLHQARADGPLPRPPGTPSAAPRRHRRTRHLGTAFRLGHRHQLARTSPRRHQPR